MISLLLAGMMGFQAGDPSGQIEFLRLSYKANKDAFAFGTFRFESTRGKSETPAKAESEVFSRAVTQEGLYIFDGKNARCEQIGSPKDLASARNRIAGKNVSVSA